jgi:hypothetical protein
MLGAQSDFSVYLRANVRGTPYISFGMSFLQSALSSIRYERGCIALPIAARNFKCSGPISKPIPGQNYSLLRKHLGQH